MVVEIRARPPCRVRLLVGSVAVGILALAAVTLSGLLSTNPVAAATGCQFLSSPGAAPAFCDTFDAPAGTGNRSGDLNGNLWGVSRISQGDNFGQGQYNTWAPTTLDLCGTNVTNVLPPDDVRICNGKLVESITDGGSQATLAMYPKQPFDFAGRTGTISFDLTNDSQGGHAAWPEIWLTDKPVPAPSNTNGGELSSYPQNGLEISFDGGGGQCNNDSTLTSVGSIHRISNYQSIDLSLTEIGCVQKSSGSNSAMNHYEIRISQNQVDVYATDPGSSTLKLIASAQNAGLTLTRGLLWMTDTHYNANKFDSQGTHTFAWDNFGFDGPVLARDLTFDAPDAMRSIGSQPNLCPCGSNIYNLGWYSDATKPATVTTMPMTAANIQAAAAVLVLANAHFDTAVSTINYSVNGHVHSTPITYAVAAKQSMALPVPASDLVAGPNTVAIWAAQPAIINNVDLLLVGAGGSGGASPTGNNPTPTPTKTQPTTSPTPTKTQPTTTPTPTKTVSPTPVGSRTATASPTSTATPARTVTTAPAVARWSMKAVSSPGTVKRGGTLTLSATVSASAAATGLVDVEVYDPSGNKSMQKFWDRQSFSGTAAKSFSASFRVPVNAQPGTWKVKVGVFGPGWAGLLGWNDTAASFTVK